MVRLKDFLQAPILRKVDFPATSPSLARLALPSTGRLWPTLASRASTLITLPAADAFTVNEISIGSSRLLPASFCNAPDYQLGMCEGRMDPESHVDGDESEMHT